MDEVRDSALLGRRSRAAWAPRGLGCDGIRALEVDDSAQSSAPETAGADSSEEQMTTKNAPRLLGAAFLIVVFTSLGSGLLLMSVVGSGGISDNLVDISNRLTLMRLFILDDLVTSLGIIVLAVLLYVVLNKQNKIMALVALGCWLTEAMSLAISKAGASALIPLSLEYVKAGAPDHSYYQTLGEFLYNGVVIQLGQTTELLFYCFGAILWYYLFYKSRYIPRAISLFGLIAVSVALVGLAVQFLGHDVSILVFLPILPFELTIGAWLMLRGIKDEVPVVVDPAR